MIIKSIKLTNIRSYISEKIDFPEGSVLLSGDIGSGKSTILLAIEFALFGAKKAELPASALLRHGKNHGNVELMLDIDGLDITISRNLKRLKDSISQEFGYIIRNGVKTEGTPVELKAHVLELLGYPNDLVTKSRDLIYRYTVYTPQEEMKKILLEKNEDRLDTLRKVFGIERYKLIRENAMVFIRHVKEKRRFYEGCITDLDEKKKKKSIAEAELNDACEKIAQNEPALEKARNSVKENKLMIKDAEAKIKALNILRQELELSDIRLKNKIEQRLANIAELERLEKEHAILKAEVSGKNALSNEEARKRISAKQGEILGIEKQLKEVNSKISELSHEARKSKSVIEKISSLDECPTCRQSVSKSHKESISMKELRSVADSENGIRELSRAEMAADDRLRAAKAELDTLREQQHLSDIIQIKQKNMEDKSKRIQTIANSQQEIKKDIGIINLAKKELAEKIALSCRIEELYNAQRKALESSVEREKEMELKHAILNKWKEDIMKTISSMDIEIREKERIKQKLSHASQAQNWLENYFLLLMSNIEKHVMLSVYHEFNSLFTEWFGILIGDEGISVRLDEEFSPVIIQNGYETQFENLSGGEKTAVSLSYRLSLNKVINDISGNIKTRDIIMLDEPTDGFSTEQLDKMRDVLEAMNIRQVIIVSHEQKIESFVNNVLRVRKEEHTSSVD